VLWAAIELRNLVRGGTFTVSEALQSIDAATSELIFLSLVVLFLVSLETRLKRRTALRMLHRLRSIAHIVDMHQLTKDPELALRRVKSTASSPSRTLSLTQLPRYLDYCSELLALTSKLAALHAQNLNDAVVLNAVNDIEALTADLSRKIWQKITILATADLQRDAATASTLDKETAG
jgi:3-methyladenine DNA glycosylase AlkC